MKKDNYRVLGVMSGTSLDGIDIAAIEFKLKGSWMYEIVHATTIPYSKGWEARLRDGVDLEESGLKTLNTDYTLHLGNILSSYIDDNSLNDLDAICSHGHTILHEPSKGVTLQIGNLQEIANLTNQQVICDFRTQDVALGGQGAPLVPIGDKLLFSNYDYCLNLGGFANISFEEKNTRLAYDVCPVNIVLNHYVNKLNLPYDDGGKIAASGGFNQTLFDELNSLSYYSEAFPKSLGLEWVQQYVFPLIDKYDDEVATILHTFVKHVAHQLVLNFKENTSILVTGGGAYNTFLMNELKKQKNLVVKIPENTLVEFKEALIFGFLGVLRLRNEVNVLSSVTGARKDHSSGKIFNPKS